MFRLSPDFQANLQTMRVRSTEHPPSQQDIDRILANGASETDVHKFKRFLRRMRMGFFLDSQNRPLSARQRLVNQYKQDGLVLFLGAGVSVESGVPNWPVLVNRVLLKSGIARRDLSQIERSLNTYITRFELAGLRAGNRVQFVKALYESLYSGVKCRGVLEQIPKKYEKQIGWPGWTRVLRCLESNKTLATVGNLLIVHSQRKPRRNPQIHAVLTFNADNLLELYCRALTKGRHIITMVDRASVGDHPDRLSVYHLHGVLDVRGENIFRCPPQSVPVDTLQILTEDLLPDLVFRESEYYEAIANPVSFVNHTPQSFLRRLNALFIGTSLDDLNMRRWLHDSFRERVEHRANYLREFYWEKFPAAEYEARLESLRHFWLRPEAEKGMNNKNWKVPQAPVNLVMGNLGVQVVWCHDFKDMRKCIKEVQKFGYDADFDRRPADYPN